MTANAATSVVAPAVPAAATAVNPIASACSPSPAANKPAPVAATPTPISVNAPANAKILGIIGDNTAPATPIIANAPAKETKPFAIASQLIAPSILRTGANTANEALAMSNAAEPANVPFIRFNAIDNSANAPPIVTRPLPISSHVKFPIVLRTFDNIVSAPATAIRPTPVDTIFLGIKLTANVISANAPAITVSPLPISSHCIEPKSSTADAIIFIAPAIAINAIPVDITCLALPVRFVNVAISASNMPILVRPFPISLHCIEPKSLQADANTFIAADSTRIPVAVDTAFPLNLAVFKNKAISAIRTPTPVNIQNGANQLFSMMKSVDGYSLSGSLDIANRTGSRINEVRSKTTDNSSVLDKISDAVGNFNGGNSFENTFNITGSNPKEIAEEVSNIIQRQVERRDASWA